VVLLGELQAAIKSSAVSGQPATAERDKNDEQYGGKQTDPDDIEDCPHTLPTPFPVPRSGTTPGTPEKPYVQ
jgi:hypothetical protein